MPEKKSYGNVLVVEDHPLDMQLIYEILDNLNFKSTLAYSGKEALEKITEEHILVLMDIGLPDINGIKTAEMIREKGYKTTPIIALTAYDETVAIPEDKKILFVKFVPKPISVSKFMNILEAYRTTQRIKPYKPI